MRKHGEWLPLRFGVPLTGEIGHFCRSGYTSFWTQSPVVASFERQGAPAGACPADPFQTTPAHSQAAALRDRVRHFCKAVLLAVVLFLTLAPPSPSPLPALPTAPAPDPSCARSTAASLVYPAYASYKAIEDPQPGPARDLERSRWLVYWAVRGAWSLIEPAADQQLSWCAAQRTRSSVGTNPLCQPASYTLVPACA